jgi:hypothetical protein
MQIKEEIQLNFKKEFKNKIIQWVSITYKIELGNICAILI